MDEDWKKKKNWSSRPSVDDWQGLHHISWINNGGKKKSLKKTHVQFSSFPLKTNCQNRTKVIKKKQQQQTKTLKLSWFRNVLHKSTFDPNKALLFFQERKQNLILWRCGEKSWPVQLKTGSRSRHELKLIHNVIELHGGLGKKKNWSLTSKPAWRKGLNNQLAAVLNSNMWYLVPPSGEVERSWSWKWNIKYWLNDEIVKIKVRQKNFRQTGSGRKWLFLKPIKRLMINILLDNFTIIPHTGCKMYKIIQSKWQKSMFFCSFLNRITMLHITNDRDIYFLWEGGKGQDLVKYKHDSWDASLKTQTPLWHRHTQKTFLF